MYDYYAYPQMFDGDLDNNNEVIQNNENHGNSDNVDGFQHVTYVNNGAVISSSKSSQLAATVATNFKDASEDTIYDTNTIVADDINYPSESIDDEEALVFINPQFGFGNNQNKYESPILDFDATLTGMMGALAEIQKKGDSMLGSIR